MYPKLIFLRLKVMLSDFNFPWVGLEPFSASFEKIEFKN